MIKVNYFTDCGDITGFDIHGHAGYDEYGKDIVCAAVSSAAYLTANTVTDVIKASADVSVDEISGGMRLCIEEKDVKKCDNVMRGFALHMQSLQKQYAERIFVEFTEVKCNA
jgi:uncharacterized protein YsxB (DUF464 family)